MPTATNKQRLLNTLFTALGKGHEPAEQSRPVLEQFLFAICREGATQAQAEKAFNNLREVFFDWNEVRVSSPREVEEALGHLPNPELRAQRLIAFLQEVFESEFSYDLEGLHKQGLKQAAKKLSRYQAANDYIGAWVVQQTLGGHAIPLDPPTLRCIRRLGLIEDEQEDLEAVRSSLEHLIPKARGSLFVETISEVANHYCHEESPRCGSCPLRAECATGHDAARTEMATTRSSRPKPR